MKPVYTNETKLCMLNLYIQYFNNDRCEEMQQLSESVFYGLCEKLGTSQQVAIRRETKDIKELLVSRARGMMRAPRGWVEVGEKDSD